ncbi:unnamed protein product [Ectocarpus fasciculatus]
MDQSFKLSDGYRNWAAFVEEFRRIEESLQESKQLERVLVNQCNQLKSELVVSGNKLHTVMSVRAEDERTMALLRKECDQSVVTSMEAKIKEKQAMTLVSGLQADVEALQAQVGVLQSALWLEKERASAAVRASRGATGPATRGGTSKAALTMTSSTSTASAAAAEAAAVASGVLANSSNRGGGGGFGSSGKRRNGVPSKRIGERGGPRRPATAPAQDTQGLRGKLPHCNAGGLYGRSKPWEGGVGGNCSSQHLDGGRGFLASERGAGAGSPDGTTATDGSFADPWASNDYFHGGSGGGGKKSPQGHQQERSVEKFVLDLDGRRGYAGGGGGDGGGGGGPGSEVESSGGGQTTITPFQRWKRERGIVSPGVAEMFGGQGCCS